MIKIKVVDTENILDVCGLTAGHEFCPTQSPCSVCTALSIARSKFNPDMYVNAIYEGNTVIGYFMYERREEMAETATIYSFMLGGKTRHKEQEEKAFEHILRGLKFQGVRKVFLALSEADETARDLYRAFGFHISEEGYVLTL